MKLTRLSVSITNGQCDLCKHSRTVNLYDVRLPTGLDGSGPVYMCDDCAFIMSDLAELSVYERTIKPIHVSDQME